MSDKQQVPEYRWDSVWHHLLSRAAPDGDNILCKLLSSEVGHYELGDVEFTEDSDYGPSNGYDNFLSQRVIFLYADHQRKKVHLKFYAGDGKGIAFEAYKGALKYARQIEDPTLYKGERWYVPRVYLLDARGTLTARLYLTVEMGKGTVTSVDIIHLSSSFPMLGCVASCDSIDATRTAVLDLCKQLSCVQADSALLKACAALADPQVWTKEGARKRVVNLLSQPNEGKTDLSQMNLDD